MKIPKQEFYVKITVPALITYDNGGPIDRCVVRNIQKAIRLAIADLPGRLDFMAPDGAGSVYEDCAGPVKYEIKQPMTMYKELGDKLR